MRDSPTVIPGLPYRHSRVSGNPVVACWGCGIIRQYRSGFPLTREGRWQRRKFLSAHPELVEGWKRRRETQDGSEWRRLILQPVQDERMGAAAAFLPSFPRKRESRGDLPGMRHHKAVPFGIPAYAGMTVGAAGEDSRKAAGRTVERGGGKDGRYRPLPGYCRPFMFARRRQCLPDSRSWIAGTAPGQCCGGGRPAGLAAPWGRS